MLTSLERTKAEYMGSMFVECRGDGNRSLLGLNTAGRNAESAAARDNADPPDHPM